MPQVPSMGPNLLTRERASIPALLSQIEETVFAVANDLSIIRGTLIGQPDPPPPDEVLPVLSVEQRLSISLEKLKTMQRFSSEVVRALS